MRSGAVSAERHRREIRGDVRREIAVRIGDLVQELLGRRRARDAAAGARDLAEHGVALGIDVRERKAQVRHVRHFLAPGIGEIAAAQLTRAFEQVADGGAAREAVDVARAQPYSCIIGATNSDGSATRPVTTTSAPLASAGSSASAPRYALADTIGA